MRLEGSGQPDPATRLDEKDRRVLARIQSRFPLCRSPYREIAREVGMGEGEVEARIRALRARGLIRRIGGVLDSRKLGFVGTLVAMKVPPARVDEVAAAINELPNVTHNYLREHDYNLWFTLTARSPEELRAILGEIQRATGITEILDLPSLETFKINVRLDFDTPCPNR